MLETSRIALIRYDGLDGKACVASGLLLDERRVLTADHVADGTRHRVAFSGPEIPATVTLRTGDPQVDLALVTLSAPVRFAGQPLSCGQVDRTHADQVTGCVAMGFPRWMKRGDRRLTAQVRGWIPTGEGLDPLADAGMRGGFLTLVGDRNPGNHPIQADLIDRSSNAWGGMSGAGVTVGDVLIGVVRSHNLAVGSQSLTVTPLTAVDALPDGLRRRFRAALGITGPELPMISAAAVGGFPVLALSAEVQETSRPVLGTALAPYGLPVGWTLDELLELRRKAELDGLGECKAADLLTALCESLTAKSVFAAIGGSWLEVSQLKVIYQREAGAWPAGNTLDALLVEAAAAGIAELRARTDVALRTLARFMVGVAAALGSPVTDGGPLARWVQAAGYSLADAQEHYRRGHDHPAWLVIDLGDEPRNAATRWPDVVDWMLVTKDDVFSGDPVSCAATKDGVRLALTEILRRAQSLPGRPLLVDLAMPRALMDEGIEHWPVVQVDDTEEPLSAWHSPRLRWARRRRDALLFNRLLSRAGQASWHGEAREWTRTDPRRACFIGGRETQKTEDSLRALLRDGGGFAIWFPAGLNPAVLRKLGKAVRQLPPVVRRDVLPDHLPRFAATPPAIIWDDPRGRGGLRLPPLVVPESLS